MDIIIDCVNPKSFVIFQHNSEFSEVVTHVEFIETNKHLEFLLPIIQEYLSKTNNSIQDINNIFLNIGPGSFNGLRVACGFASVAKNISNIDVFYYNSFDIIKFLTNLEDDNLVSIIRPNEIFYYIKQGNEIKTLSDQECSNFILENKSLKFSVLNYKEQMTPITNTESPLNANLQYYTYTPKVVLGFINSNKDTLNTLQKSTTLAPFYSKSAI